MADDATRYPSGDHPPPALALGLEVASAERRVEMVGVFASSPLFSDLQHRHSTRRDKAATATIITLFTLIRGPLPQDSRERGCCRAPRPRATLAPEWGT